jgi:hypothetical protein
MDCSIQRKKLVKWNRAPSLMTMTNQMKGAIWDQISPDFEIQTQRSYDDNRNQEEEEGHTRKGIVRNGVED